MIMDREEDVRVGGGILLNPNPPKQPFSPIDLNFFDYPRSSIIDQFTSARFSHLVILHFLFYRVQLIQVKMWWWIFFWV